MGQKALNENVKVEKLIKRYSDREVLAVVDNSSRVLCVMDKGKHTFNEDLTFEKIKKMTSIRQILTPTTGMIVVSSKWKK